MKLQMLFDETETGWRRGREVTEFKHAFFSEQALSIDGVTLHLGTIDNKIVGYTALYQSEKQGRECYKWPDAIYLGEID